MAIKARTLLFPLALLLLAHLGGCATTSKSDPLEGLNRGISLFNSGLDKALIKPAATAYVKVVPRPVRTGVNNFFGNLGDISTMVNNILQGKFTNAASDFGRLSMNSTFGILGLIDVATHLGIPKHDEDFGQTLGRWGIGSGPYLVLPLFGPSTLRDGLASIPDGYLNPANYIEDEGTRWSLFGLGIVNTRVNLMKATNILEEAALDQYVFTRDAFLQRRQRMVYDGEVPAELLQDDNAEPEELEDPEPDGKPANPPASPDKPQQ